jgi:hypothetical protein
MCHCEHLPAGRQEVKQSQWIATPACRNAISACRHVASLLAMTTFQGCSL